MLYRKHAICTTVFGYVIQIHHGNKVKTYFLFNILYLII